MAFACLFYSCDDSGNEKEFTEKTQVYQQKSLKRGVSFGFSFTEDVSVLGNAISWYYNWSPTQAAKYDELLKEMQLDFCPMAWNGIDKNALREYKERHPECKYLLTFNEPNLKDQANMTPQQSAQKWPEIKSIAKELGLKLISPAMNFGTLEGYGDPLVWLDEFFELVPLSDVDGISIHCYMAHPAALKWYVERFRKYNKPLWLTEFCAWDGLDEKTYTPEGQEQFMSDAINYLECEPLIYRYAWFIPRGGKKENHFPYNFLLKNSSCFELTSLGEVFTQMSTLDTTTFYGSHQTIEAENYSSISFAEGIGTPKWVNGPRVRLCNDTNDNSLELYDFFEDQWVEYQLQIDENKKYTLELRFASENESVVQLAIDNKLQTTYTLDATGSNDKWRTAKLPLKLERGRHTIRLTNDTGALKLNWLKFY